MNVTQRSSFKAKVGGNFRNGICDSCGIKMNKDTIILHGREKVIMRCPKCGGTTGQLIARSVSIQAPSPPKCNKPKCLWKFFWGVVLCDLLSKYHYRRVMYAQKNRYKDIPAEYRTGENAPKNIRQAILAIIKLRLRR